MQERSSPQQPRAKQTRRELLAAARRTFAESGYVGATVDDVAQAAGCTKGAYYFHFATKEDALLSLVDEWVHDRTELLESAANGDRPPKASLADLLEALLSFRPRDRWERRLLLEFWSQGERISRLGRRLSKAHRAWRRLVIDAVVRAQDDAVLPASASAGAIADVALALHDGLVMRGRTGPNARASADASTALALLRRTG